MDKNELIKEALKQYSFTNPQIKFIRHNENITYKIEDLNKSYLMRIHKPVDGYSLEIFQKEGNLYQYVNNEMQMIEYIGVNSDISMQKPIENKSGQFVSLLSNNIPVSILEWIPGETIDNIGMNKKTGKKLGRTIAKLHEVLKKYYLQHHREIVRYGYNQNLLELIEYELKSACEKRQIKKEYVNSIYSSLLKIQNTMNELDKMPEMFGVIHADLGFSNLVISNDKITPIDFSLSGIGYYYFDLAGLLTNSNDVEIRKEIKKGYEEIIGEEILLGFIEPFFALGVILFIACQHDKIYLENWFDEAIERWTKTIFVPLNNDEEFVFSLDK